MNNDLFMPKNVDDKVEEMKENLEKDFSDKVLMFASNWDIFALPNLKGGPVHVASRDHFVFSLEWSDCKLYDAGFSNEVIETISGLAVARRHRNVLSLANVNGTLYDGGLYEGVFDTLADERVYAREGPVHCMCSHDGKLFDGGDYDATFSAKVFGIYNTAEDDRVYQRMKRVWDICSHDGNLYDCGEYGLWETVTEIEKGNREKTVLSLCSHEGELYDGGDDNAIFETLTGRVLYEHGDRITALASVPRFLLKGVLG